MLCSLGLWDQFSDIPNSLRHGFRIGASEPVLVTFSPPNHKSALDNPTIIHNHIISELAEGRYFGPFTQSKLEDMIGPFQSAPLGVVEKPSSPGSFRIIQDFSFPRDGSLASLNSQINSADFKCSWGFFQDVVSAIANAGPSTKAGTCDVDSAYRQVPVDRQDWPHIVVAWEGKYYIDTRVPFGAASSNGLFGRCGDAIALIYERLGFGIILKWVDDFAFVQDDSAITHTNDTPLLFSLEAIYDVASYLGWPWKLSKSTPFSSSFKYLGFVWDILAKTVSIPDPKKKKYIARITKWLDSHKVSRKETEVIVGSLIHCALAVPDGRPHVAALISFAATFPHTHSTRFLRKQATRSAQSDAQWWRARLADTFCGCSIASPPPVSDLFIASDASTSFGIGLIIGDRWMAWRLLSSWKGDSRDIGWAEAIGVELAVLAVIDQGHTGMSITCFCDNQGVVHAWQAGRSRNWQQNRVFMRIMAAALAHNLHVRIQYIASQENPADKPSRGLVPKGYARPSSRPLVPAEAQPYLIPVSF